jgi:hypothetical protein
MGPPIDECERPALFPSSTGAKARADLAAFVACGGSREKILRPSCRDVAYNSWFFS